MAESERVAKIAMGSAIAQSALRGQFATRSVGVAKGQHRNSTPTPTSLSFWGNLGGRCLLLSNGVDGLMDLAPLYLSLPLSLGDAVTICRVRLPMVVEALILTAR